MASSFDVVKKVMRFKLQLTDTAESATVLKILQKLKDLDITLDILAETGIGKTVNSLRRHEQAGEFARSLVRCWKRLVPKDSTSHTEHGDVAERLSVRNELDDRNCPTNGSLMMEDLNNNCLMSNGKSQNSSDESLFKTENRKADSEKQCEEQTRHEDQNENEEKSKEQENQTISKRDDTYQESRSDSRKKFKSNSESGRFGSEKQSNKISKTSQESSKESKVSSSFESGEKYSNTSTLASVKDDRPSEILRSSEAQNKKRKKTGKEKHTTLKYKLDSGNKEHSKNKKAKIKHKESNGDPAEPSMSFESCLNYDVNALKRKDRSGVKKPPKKIKTASKEEATKGPGMTAFKSHVMSLNVTSPKQMKKSVMDLMDIPLPALLPEYEKPSCVEYFERKVEKESDFCDVTEESAVFTGQRLNKKMQVYSGAKTVFLPTMMSLHQQCIRTLQNNINLLYETGGVPFEILEPVLERCTPEQLLRIEECNPIYVGVTDHLWGKHCQKDFKNSKLQEYESWKEMYIRLSEERERKLQRLTKSIVSAHSSKPKGRQVKMAFIHTVAKPPRDVRIQQEIYGTAVQQPHQLRCSVKVQDNRPRPSCNEPSRCSSTSSVASATQDPRKKTRVAPMMAKSLKAFKKQLGRR
ncbi:elongin A, like [Micropterus dolomieu]|uniref:elongin A, like n=1 Tax=Micropterus dolomieu TaxID=147949 RepID=UPI001E8DF555|nr:elongin A, like [Micropterus dolomieu]